MTAGAKFIFVTQPQPQKPQEYANYAECDNGNVSTKVQTTGRDQSEDVGNTSGGSNYLNSNQMKPDWNNGKKSNRDTFGDKKYGCHASHNAGKSQEEDKDYQAQYGTYNEGYETGRYGLPVNACYALGGPSAAASKMRSIGKQTGPAAASVKGKPTMSGYPRTTHSRSGTTTQRRLDPQEIGGKPLHGGADAPSGEKKYMSVGQALGKERSATTTAGQSAVAAQMPQGSGSANYMAPAMAAAAGGSVAKSGILSGIGKAIGGTTKALVDEGPAAARAIGGAVKEGPNALKSAGLIGLRN